MQFQLRGQTWTIEREKRPGLWGECDFDARRITIHTQLRLRKRLEILIHEITHAVFPEAPEEAVTEAGKVIAGVLLADGWTRRQIKAKPKGQQMRKIRDSQVENEGKPCEVVEFEPGDTIPLDAIKIGDEWHVTKEPEPSAEPEAGRKLKKGKTVSTQPLKPIKDDADG